MAVFIVSKKQTRKRDSKHRQSRLNSGLPMPFSQNNLLESLPLEAIHSLLRQCQIFWVRTTHRILSDLARFRQFDYCTIIRDASFLGWMTCLYLPVRCPEIVTLFRVSECCHYIGVPKRNHRVKSELHLVTSLSPYLSPCRDRFSRKPSCCHRFKRSMSPLAEKKTCNIYSDCSSTVPSGTHTQNF